MKDMHESRWLIFHHLSILKIDLNEWELFTASEGADFNEKPRESSPPPDVDEDDEYSEKGRRP